MTNTSPLPVRYQWYFIEQPPVVRCDPANDDEGIDVNSACEIEDENESSEDTKHNVCYFIIFLKNYIKCIRYSMYQTRLLPLHTGWQWYKTTNI